jgi:hypothetical protein
VNELKWELNRDYLDRPIDDVLVMDAKEFLKVPNRGGMSQA